MKVEHRYTFRDDNYSAVVTVERDGRGHMYVRESETTSTVGGWYDEPGQAKRYARAMIAAIRRDYFRPV